MELNNKTNLHHKNNLEALLYFFNEPVTYRKLAKLLETDEDTVKGIVGELKEDLQDRGMKIVSSNTDAQLVAYINNDELLEKLDQSKNNNDFTPAVLETLAVVLYIGEASEELVDSIRGVKSSRTIRKLTRRGYLIEKNNAYSVSADAMRQLNIKTASDLPNYDSLKLKLHSMANNADD